MRDGGCELLLVHRSITYYHNFIQNIVLLFQRNVDNPAILYRLITNLKTHVRENKRTCW